MILPDYYGSTYQKRLMTFYAEIYKKRFGEYPKVKYTPFFFIHLKRVFDKYGEIKVAGAILVHFEQDNLVEKKFPFPWVFKSIDKYLKYLQDEIGIDIDNEQEMYDSIKNRLKYLAIPFSL